MLVYEHCRSRYYFPDSYPHIQGITGQTGVRGGSEQEGVPWPWIAFEVVIWWFWCHVHQRLNVFWGWGEVRWSATPSPWNRCCEQWTNSKVLPRRESCSGSSGSATLGLWPRKGRATHLELLKNEVILDQAEEMLDLGVRWVKSNYEAIVGLLL